MKRYKLIIEYEGTKFCGWQTQVQNNSVQQKIEEAIYKFCGHKALLFAAGRTDSGVHAWGQVAHVDLPENLTINEGNLLNAVNFYLKPDAISIVECVKVDEFFHARFSAIKRYYQYKILNRHSPCALLKDRIWHIRKKLNIAKMIEASKHLIGKHDFSSFRAAECQARSPIRTIDYIDFKFDNNIVTVEIAAKSFLHHMVRNMVGTLVLFGQEKLEPAKMLTIINEKNRSAAGPTAPACGLYFMKVEYD